MAGLEKILKAIEEVANSFVENILSQAKQEADEIMLSAKKEAENLCFEIAEKSEIDMKAAIGRAESAATLLERKMLLDAKQQLIKEVIAKAKDTLLHLSDTEYAEVIIRMVKKNAHNSQGIILFSKEDKKRLPENFAIMLNNALEEKEGASLVISEENAKVRGGFILIYGDMEENCTFDSLFAAAKDELQDKVNKLLF